MENKKNGGNTQDVIYHADGDTLFTNYVFCDDRPPPCPPSAPQQLVPPPPDEPDNIEDEEHEQKNEDEEHDTRFILAYLQNHIS